MNIIPTILEKQFDSAEEKIRLVKDEFRWIQVDVIDGYFTSGKTFELELLNKTDFETNNVLWNMHLMVKEPVKWVEKCLYVNAARVIGQVEMMSNAEEFINEVKDAGMEAGLAFDIDSEIIEIPEETDEILILGRKAGFDTADFNDEKVFKKLKQLNDLRNANNLEFKIGVDGGINTNNIRELQSQGVDIAYCGSAIFNGNVKHNIENLYDAIK